MRKEDKKIKESESACPRPQQLEQFVRYSLLTLTGIADRIKEVEPMRQEQEQNKHKPNNLLDPTYNRPWWTILAGACGLYLGYKLFGDRERETEE